MTPNQAGQTKDVDLVIEPRQMAVLLAAAVKIDEEGTPGAATTAAAASTAGLPATLPKEAGESDSKAEVGRRVGGGGLVKVPKTVEGEEEKEGGDDNADALLPDW